jgi:hypothetical protein
MAGLAYLAVIGLYFYVFYLVVRKAVHKARERGRPGWHYGLPAFLAMYLPVFWDHIPTLVIHQYQCMNNAGLTVYKTPEQWKAENPGVAETLIPNENATYHKSDGFSYFILNQRFNWETHYRRLPLGLVREEINRIVDSSLNEILLEDRDFSTNIRNPFVKPDGLRDYKLWLDINDCSKQPNKKKWFVQGKSFYTWKSDFKRIQ